ncbi:MAG: hypothetical protein A2W25_13020 [candidate division Zixibacteria bacterium RBG_16_53_22]|nr:MAG: hypothetical protein A2W25_13020 [candidate division Zixibacteria bacterium RBG_16_53_22]
MPESLGDKLRTTRESKGLTIDQVAAITKLNPHFIEALEEGRWDLLPGRVYLKSFAKIYAEALGIDIREIYEKIDGPVSDDKGGQGIVAQPTPAAPSLETTRKVDYKLPIVLTVGILVIILIIIAVRSRRVDISGPEDEDFIPARGLLRRAEIKWDRPWERPASNPEFFAGAWLTLETAEKEIWACVVADNDTAFIGTMPRDSGKSFSADSAFRIWLSRNDGIAGYLNGIQISGIGGSSKRLNNFLISIPAKDTTKNETE